MEAIYTMQMMSGTKALPVKKSGRLFGICFLSSMIGGMVSTIMSVYLPQVMEAFKAHGAHFDQAFASACINASFIFGWTFGGIICGMLGDKVSRKKSFMLATATYGVFTLLTGLASSWEWITAFRFLTGFGVGGVLVTTTILISEHYTEKKRAVLLGILSISIPVGIFSAGLLNYLVSYWRYGFSVGVLPILIAVAAQFTSPDIVPMGHKDVRHGNVQHLQEPLPPLQWKNLLVGTVIFGAALIGLWATFSWMPYWIQTFNGGNNGQQYAATAMMLMGGGGLAGGFVSGWLVHRMGVRNTMLICFAACYILCLLLFKLTNMIGPVMYAELALLALFFGISQGALSVYIPELFPKHVAATATGLCFNIGRIFTALAVFYIGSLVHLLGGYGNAVFTFSFVFVLGFLFTALSKHHSYLPTKKKD